MLILVIKGNEEVARQIKESECKNKLKKLISILQTFEQLDERVMNASEGFCELDLYNHDDLN